MRYVCVLFLSVAGFGLSFAQGGKMLEKKFSSGNKLFLKNNYRGALYPYLQCFSIDSANANLQYRIGLCYLKNGSSDSAIYYLQKAVKDVSKDYDSKSASEKASPPAATYYLGIALQEKWHFSDAVKAFKSYKTLAGSGNKAIIEDLNHRLIQCKTARMFIMAPSNARIVNVGDSINSAYDDYNPVAQPDGSVLLFTSRRPCTSAIGSVPKAGMPNRAHIYISHGEQEKGWKAAQLYGKSLNSFIESSSLSLSPDGQALLLWCNDGKQGAIYQSNLGENDWEMPQKIGADVNLVGNQSGACLSSDGNTLYFVSDRPGGIGGKDIWRCVKLPNGNWSKAMNMGEPINTPYDEESPFEHFAGKTLFFSSQGHSGMGGFDIFFSQLDDSGKYSEPFNLGYPINTPANELQFSIANDGKSGYIYSDRGGGKGGMDIYYVVMPQSSEIPLTIIRGQVTTGQGESLPDEVHIIATDNITNEEVGDFKPIQSTGKFTIIVPPGRSYTLSYLNDDNEFYKEVINVPADAEYSHIQKELNLPPHALKDKSGDTTGHKQE